MGAIASSLCLYSQIYQHQYIMRPLYTKYYFVTNKLLNQVGNSLFIWRSANVLVFLISSHFCNRTWFKNASANEGYVTSDFSRISFIRCQACWKDLWKLECLTHVKHLLTWSVEYIQNCTFTPGEMMANAWKVFITPSVKHILLCFEPIDLCQKETIIFHWFLFTLYNFSFLNTS